MLVTTQLHHFEKLIAIHTMLAVEILDNTLKACFCPESSRLADRQPRPDGNDIVAILYTGILFNYRDPMVVRRIHSIGD
jgi:hypothetical protein